MNKFQILLDEYPRYANTEQRQIVYERDAGRCQYCGDEVSITGCNFDHVIPWPEGATDVDNLVVACYFCNQMKRNQFIPIQFRPIPGVVWDPPMPAKLLKHFSH